MDTSKTYIKMSLKAWGYEKIEAGVLFSTQSDAIMVSNEGKWYAEDDSGFIPLKTQDQLQEMVGCHSLFELTKLFESFCYLLPWGQSPHKSGGRFYGMRYTSMEQLWLAFVMKEKHNKVWNGEKWNDYNS